MVKLVQQFKGYKPTNSDKFGDGKISPQGNSQLVDLHEWMRP